VQVGQCRADRPRLLGHEGVGQQRGDRPLGQGQQAGAHRRPAERGEAGVGDRTVPAIRDRLTPRAEQGVQRGVRCRVHRGLLAGGTGLAGQGLRPSPTRLSERVGASRKTSSAASGCHRGAWTSPGATSSVPAKKAAMLERGRNFAARRQGGDERGRHPAGFLVVREKVQEGEQQHRRRAVEVQQAPHRGVGQDRGGLAAVGREGHGTGVVPEDRPAVSHGHRVEVHVGHVGGGVGVLGDLVDIADGRDARADIEELRDPARGEEADDAAQEGAVGLRARADVGGDRQDRLGRRPVDGEIVVPAEVVVVHAGHARPVRRDLGRGRRAGVIHRRPALLLAPGAGARNLAAGAGGAREGAGNQAVSGTRDPNGFAYTTSRWVCPDSVGAAVVNAARLRHFDGGRVRLPHRC